MPTRESEPESPRSLLGRIDASIAAYFLDVDFGAFRFGQCSLGRSRSVAESRSLIVVCIRSMAALTRCSVLARSFVRTRSGSVFCDAYSAWYSAEKL